MTPNAGRLLFGAYKTRRRRGVVRRGRGHDENWAMGKGKMR
jgi:hypothetical protein